jgi:hypothetical protein
MYPRLEDDPQCLAEMDKEILLLKMFFSFFLCSDGVGIFR